MASSPGKGPAGGDASAEDDLVEALSTIRTAVSTRFAELRRAFRLIDEDKSGKLSTREMRRLLMLFNLTQIKESTFDKIVEMADVNHDGLIDFEEFCMAFQA